MATIKMPTEIAPKRNISVLIYGQPSIGKTTLACSASNAVLFDYDNGVNRINPAHVIPTLQVESWEDTANALAELDTNPMFAHIQTIIIDTAGKMLDFMSEYIMRTNPKMKQYDGSLSLKGYGQRKTMFVEFLRNLSIKGKNIIFVAHEKEEKDGDNTIKRPLVSGSSASDLMQELDLVGYMQTSGNVRTISFNPSDAFYAKNSCYIPDSRIPIVVDANGELCGTNDFMETGIFAQFRANQAKKAELTRQYNALIQDVKTIVDGVKDIDALNDAFKSFADMNYVFDAKLRAKRLLGAKAQELSAEWSKADNCFIAKDNANA